MPARSPVLCSRAWCLRDSDGATKLGRSKSSHINYFINDYEFAKLGTQADASAAHSARTTMSNHRRVI